MHMGMCLRSDTSNFVSGEFRHEKALRCLVGTSHVGAGKPKKSTVENIQNCGCSAGARGPA